MYTANLIKTQLEKLYEKFEIEMPQDLTAAYKKISGVQSLGYTNSEENTIEQLFDNAQTDTDKEFVYNSLVRLLPHGSKGIDYDETIEPSDEPSNEPSDEPLNELTPDSSKISDIDTQEEKDELIAAIEEKKNSTETEDLEKYDLDNDGDIDDDDKELASKIIIEDQP